MKIIKKIILSFLLFISTICCLAEEHLSFKGIPIEGSMKSFCQKLESKGLTKISSNNNTTLFVGDFTGCQATIGVKATDDGNNVHSVIVFFNANKEWNYLVTTYDYYKDIYIRKYGEPAFSKEYNPSKYDSNNSLMYELEQGRVTYISEWEVPGGRIDLSIEKTDTYLEGMLVIAYCDSQNIEAKIQKDLEEI